MVAFALLLSGGSWLLMPEDVVLAAGIYAAAHSDVVVLAGLAALTAFGVGSLFARGIRGQGSPLFHYSPAVLVARMKGLTLFWRFAWRSY